MDEYMLIFRHEDGGKLVSPEQMQFWMKQTMDWIATIRAKDKFIEGKGFLFGDAHVVHFNGIVTEGPFGELNQKLGGYIVVKADSPEEAIEFAKGSPVLQGDGNTVEMRRLVGSND